MIFDSIRRSRSDRYLAGVCGGIAEALGWDPTIVRLLFVIIFFPSFGTGLILYLVLAWLIPEEA